VLEDLSPLLDGINVSSAGFALSNISWEISDGLSNKSNSLHDVLEVLLLEVSNSHLNIFQDVLRVGNTGIEIWEFSVDKSLKKSLNEKSTILCSLVILESFTLNWSENISQNVSGIVSSSLEALGFPVLNHLASVFLNLSIVSESVGEDDRHVGLNVCELRGPLLDDGEVTSGGLAVRKGNWSLLGNLGKDLSGFDHAGDGGGLNISHNLLDLWDEDLGFIDALLDGWQVVLFEDSSEESVQELSGFHNLLFLVSLEGRLLNWSEGVNQNRGHVFSSIVVVRTVKVSLKRVNVCSNLGEVLQDVHENDLRSGGDVGELSEVSFNSIDVPLDVLAVSKCSWELLADLDHFFNSINDAGGITLLEVCNSGSNFLSNDLSVGHAGLEFWEVVLRNKTLKKSSSEVNDIVTSHSGGNGSKGCNKSGSHDFS